MKAPCSVLLISPEATLAEDLAEAIVARTTPAWHREPAPVQVVSGGTVTG